MRISTLLLGSAAALVGGSAFAADLPSKKSAPVEYVRVCSTFGAGFFYIPGTDTCIKIGGRARYDFGYATPFSRSDNITGSAAVGRIYADARNATQYGLLRAVVRFELARGTGVLKSGDISPAGAAYGTNVRLDRAFIQFGGLTAGRTQSFFDFYAGDLEIIGTTAGDGSPHNMFAYTASFGSGFSATLGIEDGIENRGGIVNVSGPALTTGGNSAPDVVANVRMEQAWGAAQLSGAVHQVRLAGPTPTFGAAPSSDYGFAVNGGLQFNLPFSAGDQLWLQGTYVKGNVTRLTGNGISSGAGLASFTSLVDGAVVSNGSTGKVELTSAWALTAALLHNWTPTVSQSLFGSYAKVDVPGVTTLSNGSTYRDFTYWTVGTNVAWSPVKDFVIAGEVDYLKVEGSGAFTGKKSDDTIISRLRVQRDF